MYNTTLITAEIDLGEYIRDYREPEKFIGYCKQCDRYNSCWACPPFDFDTEEYIAPYDRAYIIGIKINLIELIIRDNQGWDKCTKISYEIIEEVRKVLDQKLLLMEKCNPQSKAFFAGTCHVCSKEKCTRIKGEPCIAPESIRPSLESFRIVFSIFATHWFGYVFRHIRRRGNQVQILNRPATVSPMQRFDNSKSHCILTGMWEGSSKRGQVRRPASAYNF